MVLFGLVARNPHGTAFEEALSQMLPMEALHFATVEEPAAPTPVAAETLRADPNEGRYRALSGFLARRYRVSEDATFDLVLISEVLEHVPDTAHLLLEVRRVLRPGGRLLVTVPDHRRLRTAVIALTRFEAHFDPLGQHVRFYTRRSLATTLEHAGFEDVRVRSGLTAWARRP